MAKPFHRRDFFVLRRLMDDPLVTVVYGPRQVGKTTLLYQLVRHLIEERQVDPQRVVFFSFDHLLGVGGEEDLIPRIIDAYVTSVLGSEITRRGDQTYFFFDEVARLEGWSAALKGYVDQKYRIKFIVSDSSQSLILSGLAKDLVGRNDARLVLPLKFSDFISYRLRNDGISKAMLDFRETLKRAFLRGSASQVTRCLREVEAYLAPFDRRVRSELNRYLLVDGFPGLLDVTDYKEASRSLRHYVELTLYRDVVRVFEVRNPKTLEELAGYIADNSSARMNYQNMAQTLKIRNETLKDYLDYLESVFLVVSSEYYSKSRAKRLRRPRKLYFRDCGLRNAITGSLDRSLLADSARLGPVVETVVADHALRLQFHLTGESKIRYWQDSADREVDMVLEAGRRALAIECKYRRTIDSADLRAVGGFLEENPGAVALVVTRDVLERRGNLVLVPLHVFLMCC